MAEVPPISPNHQVAERLIARHSVALSQIIRELSLLGDPATETFVLAHLNARMVGYLCAALTASTPGSVFTFEAVCSWLTSIADDAARLKQGEML